MDHDVRTSCLQDFLSGHTQINMLIYKVYLFLWNLARRNCRYDTFHLAKTDGAGQTARMRLRLLLYANTEDMFSRFEAHMHTYSTKLPPQRLFCSFMFTNRVYCVALLNIYM